MKTMPAAPVEQTDSDEPMPAEASGGGHLAAATDTEQLSLSRTSSENTDVDMEAAGVSDVDTVGAGVSDMSSPGGFPSSPVGSTCSTPRTEPDTAPSSPDGDSARMSDAKESPDAAHGDIRSEETISVAHWDSNVITPGTPFMEKVAEAIRYYIQERLKKHSLFKDVRLRCCHVFR